MRTPRARGAATLVAALPVLALLASCSGAAQSEDARGTTLRVLAAAPLAPAFDRLEKAFEDDHRRVDLVLTYGTSGDLAAALAEDGSAADVLATADERSMNQAADAVAGPVSFATARLVLVVSRQSGAPVRRPADLQSSGAAYALCADSAPCGRIGRALLQAAGVRNEPSRAAGDATDVLDEVMQGSSPAGVVYAGQVRSLRDRLRVVALPGEAQRANEMFVAPVSLSEHPDLAQDWIDLVLGERGRAALEAAGFTVPRD